MSERKVMYDEYLKYQKDRGFKVSRFIYTQLSTDYIIISEVSKNETKVFLDIRCPAGKNITFPGRNQFKNPEDAYSQYVNIFDDEGNNIDFSNVIKIEKVKTSESHLLIDTVLYNDISLYNNGLVKKDYNKFRFDEGFDLMSEDRLRFKIVNSKNNINKVKFIIECDMLEKCYDVLERNPLG